ncbi:MAG TPA: hypothetical protein VNB91_12380, partial [Jatrophihabitantaceae bacterium]|nr:hypothetical protein [Jatrophihabitantaceae bacterium]
RSQTRWVPRPNMAGALVIKAAAWTNLQDRYRDRHLTDFALLAAMVQRSDALATAFRPHDVKYLLPTLAGLAARPEVVASIAGSDRGLDVLGRIVNGR